MSEQTMAHIYIFASVVALICGVVTLLAALRAREGRRDDLFRPLIRYLVIYNLYLLIGFTNIYTAAIAVSHVVASRFKAVPEFFGSAEFTQVNVVYLHAPKPISKLSFDIVVLDIMGVNGYGLLEKAKERDMMVVMLTAQALDAQNLSRSYREGAASYIPKEKMSEICIYLNDILEAKEKGKSFWWRWLDRLEEYFDEKFGPDWQEKHQIKIR